MSSTFGTLFKLTTFGESHSPALGGSVDGCLSGLSLSEADIHHYCKIVTALHQTIRLMAEIDEVIEAYGGWPIE